MKKRFRWTTTTASDIDWTTYGANLQQLSFSTHKFVVKMIHERLPVLGATYNPSPNVNCPCCHTTKETTYHFHICPKNPESWKGLLPEITKIYKANYIDPILRMIINKALNKNPTIAKLQKEHPHIKFKPYKRLIDKQAQIGWKQLKYGRWSKQWEILQQRYSNKQKVKNTRTIWIGQVIRCLWNHTKTRWNARNSHLHDKDKNDQYNATKERLIARIKAIHKHKDKLITQDQFPFQRTIEEWKDITTAEMKHWLSTNIPFVNYCLKVTHTQEDSGCQDIRHYFNTQTNNPKQRTSPQVQKRRRRKKQKTQKTTIEKFITRKRRKNQNQDRNQRTKYYKYQDKPPDSNNSVPTKKMVQLSLWPTRHEHTP